VGVGDAHTHEEHRRAVRQVGVDLERGSTDAFPLVHAQDRRAVISFRTGRKEGRTRERAVADCADVPLDAAAEPGIADGQIGRLKDGIDAEQFSFAGLW
jgi:hypothetical protein